MCASSPRRLRSNDRQRTIKNGQADDFILRHMRPVLLAFRGKEKRTACVSHPRFLPISREHINKFICLRMRVRRHGHPGMKLSQHRHTASRLVLMQNHQLHTGIRSRLPLFILCQSRVLKHDSMEIRCGQKARRSSTPGRRGRYRKDSSSALKRKAIGLMTGKRWGNDGSSMP